MDRPNRLNDIKAFAVLLLFLYAAIPSEARLGETPVEFADRYGPPRKGPINPSLFPPLLREAEIRYYTKGGWRITAAFLGIASPAVRVEFTKTNALVLTEEEIATILNANSRGLKWQKMPYQNPSASKRPHDRIAQAIAAPAFGMVLWKREDGAIARLQIHRVLRLELPEAAQHEQTINHRKEEMAEETRPNF